MCKKIILIIAVFVLFTLSANAEDTLITVIVPNSAAETTTEANPAVSVSELYPLIVNEKAVNGRREIVKTYELSAKDKPADISRDSFEREGWLYELADITKNGLFV